MTRPTIPQAFTAKRAAWNVCRRCKCRPCQCAADWDALLVDMGKELGVQS